MERPDLVELEKTVSCMRRLGVVTFNGITILPNQPYGFAKIVEEEVPQEPIDDGKRTLTIAELRKQQGGRR